MKAFEYASPRSEEEAVELLAHSGTSELLAGGTDLLGLMKKMIITPDRVVSLGRVESLKAIEADSQSFRIGAMATLDDVIEHPATCNYPALLQALEAHGSLQIRSQGTLGGELCQRPRCWYFRNGNGLLTDRGRHVAEGDNRFHAIFGNAGPAKFTCASRVAPALIALSATVRVIGPEPGDQTQMPLELLFRTPQHEGQREHDLAPNQFVAEIVLPPVDGATRQLRSAPRSRWTGLSIDGRGGFGCHARQGSWPMPASCWARRRPRRGCRVRRSTPLSAGLSRTKRPRQPATPR